MMKKEEVKKPHLWKHFGKCKSFYKYEVMLLSLLVFSGSVFLSQDPSFLPLRHHEDCRENGSSVILFISSKWGGGGKVISTNCHKNNCQMSNEVYFVFRERIWQSWCKMALFWSNHRVCGNSDRRPGWISGTGARLCHHQRETLSVSALLSGWKEENTSCPDAKGTCGVGNDHRSLLDKKWGRRKSFDDSLISDWSKWKTLEIWW